VYGADLQDGLVLCWAVLRAPAGKLLAPMLPVLVPMLRSEKALDITDGQAALLARMSAATIDRRLAGQRAKLLPRGRSYTKPGSLLKSQIPIRTWAQCDDAVPGFVEIDLVAHDGSNGSGQYCFTLTVTDIATGWTVNRSVPNKAQKHVFSLQHILAVFPFPVIGIDSDNGSEFINNELFEFCVQHHITFTRSRPSNKNDGAHVEQKNWSRVRELVRCVSATHEALGAIRVMPSAFAMGEASGTAAALAASSGVDPRSVSIRQLQSRMLEQGAILGKASK
jgi:hypothetical protein